MTHESFRPQLTNDNSQQTPSNLQSESVQLMGDRGGRSTQQKPEPKELVFDTKIWGNDSKLDTRQKTDSQGGQAAGSTKVEQKQNDKRLQR